VLLVRVEYYLVKCTSKKIEHMALMYKLLSKSLIELDSFMMIRSRILIEVLVRTNWFREIL
jgi:hypothetical protein